MVLTLSETQLGPALERLVQANSMFERNYPAEAGPRQPVHTVYGGAHRFASGTVAKLGAIAVGTLRQYLPDATTLAAVTGMTETTAATVHTRVSAKLEREPIEDFRIDFEDGYGYHSDEDEDRHAAEAASHLVRSMNAQTLPPFIGIRIKSFTNELLRRAMRTLDLFLTAMLDSATELPANFVVTLPKVTAAVQAATLDEMLSLVEQRFDLAPKAIGIELMMEAPQLIIDARGVCAIPELIEAAAGRCRGLHFGPYDYTSATGILGSHQSLYHPSCDFARHVMQVATAQTGVLLSDGPTKTIPIPPHRAATLSPQQETENRQAMHRAMRTHYDDVRRSLHHGYYQGWDLHPAQFPTRYAAVYSFFLEGLEVAAGRLRHFLDTAAQATTLGTVFDDAASAQGLLNFFLQGSACGAFTEDEVATAGLTIEELRTRSFTRIMESRRR